MWWFLGAWETDKLTNLERNDRTSDVDSSNSDTDSSEDEEKESSVSTTKPTKISRKVNKKLRKISKFLTKTNGESDVKLPKQSESMNPEQVKICLKNFQNTCGLHNDFTAIIGTKNPNSETGKILSNGGFPNSLVVSEEK